MAGGGQEEGGEAPGGFGTSGERDARLKCWIVRVRTAERCVQAAVFMFRQ